MEFRLWYPQLDVYDAIRRIALLLTKTEKNSLPLERLYICDFYFSNPALLHSVNMTQGTRSKFYELEIRHPSKEFISLPSAPILYQRMEEIQKSAIRTLAGKDLIDQSGIANSVVTLTQIGVELGLRFSEQIQQKDRRLLSFLTSLFAKMDEGNIKMLRRRTGLRRTVR